MFICSKDFLTEGKMLDLSKFKVEQSKPGNDFRQDLKSYFLAPLTYGLIGFIVVLTTIITVRLFFLTAANEFHFAMNSNEMIFSLLTGAFFFGVSLKNKIKEYSIK